jgi:selenide,water dikinase
VTGFGLLGHLRNITAASGVTAGVWADHVPVLAAAREYVAAGIAPGGTRANLAFLADWVSYGSDVSEADRLLLCDAQTSGGLLAAVPAGDVDATLRALADAGVTGVIVGKIGGRGNGMITVVNDGRPG